MAVPREAIVCTELTRTKPGRRPPRARICRPRPAPPPSPRAARRWSGDSYRIRTSPWRERLPMPKRPFASNDRRSRPWPRRGQARSARPGGALTRLRAAPGGWLRSKLSAGVLRIGFGLGLGRGPAGPGRSYSSAPSTVGTWARDVGYGGLQDADTIPTSVSAAVLTDL